MISQNRDYIQTRCNNRRNTFHFACRQWYSRYIYMNSNKNNKICLCTRILVSISQVYKQI